MEIIRSRDFQNNCQIYKESKKQLKASTEIIQKAVDENTKKEVKQVKDAIENLNKKVEKIMKHPTIKNEKEKIEKNQEKLFLSINKVMTVYQQARDIILKDNQLTEEDKVKYLKSLENKMLEKLYSPEEVAQFKKMLNNMVVILPGGGMGAMGGMGRLGIGSSDRKDKKLLGGPKPSTPPQKGSSWW